MALKGETGTGAPISRTANSPCIPERYQEGLLIAAGSPSNVPIISRKTQLLTSTYLSYTTGSLAEQRSCTQSVVIMEGPRNHKWRVRHTKIYIVHSNIRKPVRLAQCQAGSRCCTPTGWPATDSKLEGLSLTKVPSLVASNGFTNSCSGRQVLSLQVIRCHLSGRWQQLPVR